MKELLGNIYAALPTGRAGGHLSQAKLTLNKDATKAKIEVTQASDLLRDVVDALELVERSSPIALSLGFNPLMSPSEGNWKIFDKAFVTECEYDPQCGDGGFCLTVEFSSIHPYIPPAVDAVAA